MNNKDNRMSEEDLEKIRNFREAVYPSLKGIGKIMDQEFDKVMELKALVPPTEMLVPSFILGAGDGTGQSFADSKARNEKGICGKFECGEKINENSQSIIFSGKVCNKCQSNFQIMREKIFEQIEKEEIESYSKMLQEVIDLYKKD